MTPDDADGGPPRAGFHSYADDTPRETRAVQATSRDPPGPLTARRRQPLIVAGGALAAIVAGVLLAHGDFRRGARPASMNLPPASGPISLEVAKAPPPTPPTAAAPLEVLPPDMAANPGLAVARPGPAPSPAIEPPPRLAEARPPAPLVPASPPPSPAAQAPPAVNAAATAPPTQPAFNCSRAHSLAADMVCHDPRLAAADRRMAHAFVAALAAGADEADLRADQADWLAIREDAARHSPQAVASIYRQRIAELEDIARDGPR